jgi:two-component system cell cycle response regulator
MTRILVVDDFADARDLLSTYLASRGFETEEAVDGEDAIARALERPPDVILMDIAMPKMDGVEATERLKADPRTAHVPVIAVTGQAREPGTVSPPCDAVLVKPVDPVRVEEEIRRVLAASSSGASALSAARAASSRSRRSQGKAARGAAARTEVWLIQEDGAVRSAIVSLLERGGLEVRALSSLDGALHELEARAPDAVVVDLDLDTDSVIELALTLRDDPSLESLVLIALEPESGVPEEIHPLFDALVAKSDDIVRLPTVLARALEQVKRERDAVPEEVSVAIGDRLCAREGAAPFGVVLEIRRDFVMVDVTGAGAFVVPASAVVSVRAGTIIVDPAELDDDLRKAIGEG